MIHTLPAPPLAPPPGRTPGRYEGLYNFAITVAGLMGQDLRHWSVLDVGGADGWLGEILICAQYVCVDPQAIDPRLRARAEALPSGDGTFDLVVSKQTLPHLDDPIRAVHEMQRVAHRAVVLRQEFPESPIGWLGHSRCQIDSPQDILEAFAAGPAGRTVYDGTDFVWRRELG